MFLTKTQYSLTKKRDTIIYDAHIHRYVKLSNSGIIRDLYIVPFITGDTSFGDELFYQYIK